MSDPLLQILRERFGHPDFRGVQREVLEHLLQGGDALVVMPTGSGKSLLYQLPPLLLRRPAIVLSPLIALMKDQVDQLRARRIPASFVNSSLDRSERQRRLARFVAGEIPILYVTPERFRVEEFAREVAGVPLGLLAVDEAHCASEWGHDFRPQYSQIARIRDLLGRPPTLALTATATERVQQEILQLVGIPGARRFHTGIERGNLFLAATVWVDEEQKWRRVADLQERLPGAGIVYGALIQDLHRLEQHLARSDRRTLLYHGDLSREERRSMQDEFMQGARTRVLATSAFGMGVDKSDIRSVLHHQVPGSVEAYYQEVGRAGRDGSPSYCELLYCEQDLPIQVQFVEWANPPASMLRDIAEVLMQWGEDLPQHDREDLSHTLGLRRGAFDGRIDTCLGWLQVLGVVDGTFESRDLRVRAALDPAIVSAVLRPEKKERDLRRLWHVVEYVRSTRCRRAWLEEYFGVRGSGEPCAACDVCVDREEWIDRHLAAEPRAPDATAVPGTQPPLRRGDFVRVDGGRHVGRVTRITGKGPRLRLEVECSEDLVVRRFEGRRHRIERLGNCQP